MSPEVEVRKSAIIDAASELFEAKGFVATTTAEISRRAGISHGTLFNHFATKKQVLVAVGKARLASYQTAMRSWVRDGSLTPEQKLTHLLNQIRSTSRFRLATEHLGFGFFRQDPEIHDMFVRLAVPLFLDDLECMLREGKAAGAFTFGDARSTALCIILLAGELIHRSQTFEDLVPWNDLHETLCSTISAMLGVSGLVRETPIFTPPRGNG